MARRNSDSIVSRSVLRERMAGLNISMRSPPMRLAWYIASSASLSTSSVRCGWLSASASPIEAVRKISRSLKAIGARKRAADGFGESRRCARARAPTAGSCANWSPDSRASVSCGLSRRPSRRAIVSRIESPTAMPTESLTCLKRSRSITMIDGADIASRPGQSRSAASSRSMNSSRLGRPVRLSCTASCSSRSSAVLNSVTSVSVPTSRTTSPSEPTTGRAFSANQR